MHHQQPLISVITPVGPRHLEHVRVAHASLLGQTIPRGWWEHVIDYDHDRTGPAATRNRALRRARGAFVVALDADDYLIPTALETYLRGYVTARDACYVYADNYVINADGTSHYSNSQEYDQRLMAKYNQHVVTALYPTALVAEVGGWDEGVDIWEDWTLPLKLAIRGWCGHRLRQPALVYRLAEGERMARGMAGGIPLMEHVWRRYANAQGAIEMCGCNKPAAVASAQQQAAFAVQVLGGVATVENGLTRLEYQGQAKGSFTVTSPATRRAYKLGGRRLVDAEAGDVEWLIGLGCAPVIRTEFSPPPEPATLAEPKPGWVVADGTEAESVAVGAPEPAPLDPAGDEPPHAPTLVPGPVAPTEGESYQPKTLRRRAG